LTNDTTSIKLPTLPSTGTYTRDARVTDLAGNQGTSKDAANNDRSRGPTPAMPR